MNYMAGLISLVLPTQRAQAELLCSLQNQVLAADLRGLRTGGGKGYRRSTITQNTVIAMRCPYLAPIQCAPSYLLECVHEQQTQNGRYTWYTCNMYNQAEDKLVWRITRWAACSNLKALQEQPRRVLTISLVSKSTNKGLVQCTKIVELPHPSRATAAVFDTARSTVHTRSNTRDGNHDWRNS